MRELELSLTQQKKEFERNKTRLVTKIKRISLSSNGKILHWLTHFVLC